MITDEQREVMHHFMNAVAKSMEIFMNRQKGYAPAVEAEKMGVYVGMMEQDYEDLWDMIESLKDSLFEETDAEESGTQSANFEV